MSEGVSYCLECWHCRLVGKKFIYIGESSRSACQRGREHLREMHMGKRTHPMVDHFEERHQGDPQFVVMRILMQAKTAMQRQVWESVTIDFTAEEVKAGCLNSKCEWGQ